jgi:hypothetical protein
MELEGKIIHLGGIETGVSKQGNKWQKQEFVIETKDQYPRKVMMSVMGDKVNELKRFAVGNEIKASLNIESREYNGRWYTDVRAWKLEGNASAASDQQEDPFHPDNEPSFNGGDSSTDDLPF